VQENNFNPSTDIESLAPRFEALGLGEIAARLRALSEPAVPVDEAPFPAVPTELGAADLLSIDAAASTLGLRSSSMVTTLAELGKLQAYWSGQHVVLSRQSVESYACSPVAGTQRQVEQQLLAILDSVGDL
jgi:hypothetical protein